MEYEEPLFPLARLSDNTSIIKIKWDHDLELIINLKERVIYRNSNLKDSLKRVNSNPQCFLIEFKNNEDDLLDEFSSLKEQLLQFEQALINHKKIKTEKE
jgi:hypothetical protein